MRIVDNLEFEGITYVAQNYDPSWGVNQCDACDLNIGGRKRCLNNACDCGDCGKGWGSDYNHIVFKITKLTPEQKAKLRVEQLEREVESLKTQNKRLTYRLRKANETIEKYQNKINDFKSQMEHIYGKINLAIKREIYKNF